MPIIHETKIYEGDLILSPKCRTKLSVDLKTYESGKSFYYINYSQWSCNPKDHPVLDEDNLDGDIIVQNPMTVELIKLLIMEEEKLKEYTGHTTASEYKMKLVKNIATLWD